YFVILLIVTAELVADILLLSHVLSVQAVSKLPLLQPSNPFLQLKTVKKMRQEPPVRKLRQA
ncbi:MAG: hypothetical protein MJA30_37700, partial [Cytophagales bacterium]|nr:hypothetical protein [Cytophagales bacterium]